MCGWPLPTCLHRTLQIHICPKALLQSSLRGPNESMKPVNGHSSCLTAHSSSPYLVLHGLVDPVDQPGERLSIDGFGQSISGIDGVISHERTENLYSERKSVEACLETQNDTSTRVCVPDLHWLRSFCTPTPRGDCQRQHRAAVEAVNTVFIH